MDKTDFHRLVYYVDEPTWHFERHMMPIDPQWLTTPELRGRLWEMMDRLSRLESGPAGSPHKDRD